MQKKQYPRYQKSRKTWCGFLVALIFGACILPVEAGLTVYYLRHCESGANAVWEWEKKAPKEEWPDYVGNADTFSPRGWEQSQEAVGKLQKLMDNKPFDFIAVSPLWRTRNTILPYLKATNQKGEIWPELEEMDEWRDDKKWPTDLPEPSEKLLGGGEDIVLPTEEKEYFTIRPDGTRRYRHVKGSDAQMEADRQAIVKREVELIKEKFAGKDQTILLMGHGNAGRLLAAELAQDKDILAPGTHTYNIHIWKAEEQPDGTFKITMYNDGPWPREKKDKEKK